MKISWTKTMLGKEGKFIFKAGRIKYTGRFKVRIGRFAGLVVRYKSVEVSGFVGSHSDN